MPPPNNSFACRVGYGGKPPVLRCLWWPRAPRRVFGQSSHLLQTRNGHMRRWGARGAPWPWRIGVGERPPISAARATARSHRIASSQRRGSRPSERARRPAVDHVEGCLGCITRRHVPGSAQHHVVQLRGALVPSIRLRQRRGRERHTRGFGVVSHLGCVDCGEPRFVARGAVLCRKRAQRVNPGAHARSAAASAREGRAHSSRTVLGRGAHRVATRAATVAEAPCSCASRPPPSPC
jgi:hypothetical protein